MTRPKDPGPADGTSPLPGLPRPRGAGDGGSAPADGGPPPTPPPEHRTLTSLLGAWALAVCSPEETRAVEDHLTDCAGCADEALWLRDAVALLHPEDGLDLDPLLRSHVLASCLGRRPARIPVPEYAGPYDAETARLDALLHDMAAAEWRAPVTLRWFDGERSRARDTTVAGVIGHLLAVDSLTAVALGLPDPLGDPAPPGGPTARTEACWRSATAVPRTGPAVREPWREQTRALVRTVSFKGEEAAGLPVPYDRCELPLRDAFLDRAFACWVHAGDIAEAVDYPYELPAGAHLHLLIDLAVRRLPHTIAARRRAGLAAPPQRLMAAGTPGRTLHLEVEGSGGGHWYLPLDSPAAVPAPELAIAHLALDGMEFCRLAAGRVPPQEVAAGREGDPGAILDVLLATASLSRL